MDGRAAAPRWGRWRAAGGGSARSTGALPATISWNPSRGSSPSDRPMVPMMNENSPIWPSPAATVRATRSGWPASHDRGELGGRLGDDDHGPGRPGSRWDGSARRPGRAASRPTRRTGPRTRPAAAARRPPPGGSCRTRLTTSAGQERAERERDPEHGRRDERDAERDREDRQREQLARALARDLEQEPRDERAPATIIRTANTIALPMARPISATGPSENASASPADPPNSGAIDGSSTSTRTVKRSSTMSQPTASLPWGVSSSRAIAHRPQQDDRARDRHGQAEDESGARPPAEELSRGRCRGASR